MKNKTWSNEFYSSFFIFILYRVKKEKLGGIDMAYTITKQGGVTKGYVTSFQVDTRDDIASLPISPEAMPGSDCIVIEDATVWLLSTDGVEWKELGEG